MYYILKPHIILMDQSTNYLNNNLNNIMELDPKAIAQKIFTEEPKSRCHYGFFSEDANDVSMIFEILLSIMMEGFSILTNSFDGYLDGKTITPNDLLSVSPWFESIGFRLDVSIDNGLYDDVYCKIILNDNIYRGLFMFKQIESNYHFILNGDKLNDNREKTNLDELIAALKINNQQETLLISFMKIEPMI